MGLNEKLKNDGYKPVVDYPVCPTRPYYPVLGNRPTSQEVTNYMAELQIYEFDLVEYERKYEAYKEAEKEYVKAVALKEEEFKNDLEEYYGVKGHPKASMLYNLAWDHGHSAGYGEIANYYSEFVDLIK